MCGAQASVVRDLYWIVSELVTVVGTNEGEQSTTINRCSISGNGSDCGTDIENESSSLNQTELSMSYRHVISSTPGTTKFGNDSLRSIIYINYLEVTNIGDIGIRLVGRIDSEIIFAQSEWEI